MRGDEHESLSVHVRDYPPETTEEDVRRHFDACGRILNVDIRDSNHSGRFCFVDFADMEAARHAVTRLHDSVLLGRKIRVKYSKKKGPHPHAPSSSPPLPPPIPVSHPTPISSSDQASPSPNPASACASTPARSPPSDAPLSDTDPRSPWLFADDKPLLTPSYCQDIPSEVELQLRQTTAWYIADLQSDLKLPKIAAFSAQIYMNRFFMLHSFKAHDRFLVGSAALFVSAKINECAVKLTELTEKSLMRVDGSSQPSATDVEHVKKKIRQYEVVLLNTLSYDVVVPQPFLPLAALADKVQLETDFPREQVLHVAYCFLNDAVAGLLALQLTMEEMAVGAFYLSCNVHQCMKAWMDSTTLFSHVDIPFVTKLFLNMYSAHRGSLPPTLQALF